MGEENASWLLFGTTDMNFLTWKTAVFTHLLVAHGRSALTSTNSSDHVAGVLHGTSLQRSPYGSGLGVGPSQTLGGSHSHMGSQTNQAHQARMASKRWGLFSRNGEKDPRPAVFLVSA